MLETRGDFQFTQATGVWLPRMCIIMSNRHTHVHCTLLLAHLSRVVFIGNIIIFVEWRRRRRAATRHLRTKSFCGWPPAAVLKTRMPNAADVG